MIRRKVLHIVEDLEVGGLERVVESIALGLNKNKYDVQVWCLSKGGAIAEELVRKGMLVKILRMSSYHNPIQVIKLSKLLKLSKIDIVHTHGYFGSTFGRLAAILAGTPAIFTHVHTSDFRFKKHNILVEKFLSYFRIKLFRYLKPSEILSVILRGSTPKKFVSSITALVQKRSIKIK